jgi:hypothetical protein
MRLIALAIVTVEKEYYTFRLRACSFSYTTGKAHELYVHSNLWPVRLYRIFQNYLRNGKNFGKKR